MVERRKAKRFKLALPVHLKSGTGMTRDISTSGILFETANAYSVGDTINLSVDLRDSTLRCEGSVVRVEKVHEKFGISVEFTVYQFI